MLLTMATTMSTHAQKEQQAQELIAKGHDAPGVAAAMEFFLAAQKVLGAAPSRTVVLRHATGANSR